MENALFKLDNYQFPKAVIDFTKAEGKNELELQFAPEGQFEKDKRLFRLHFSVRICLNNSEEPAIEVHCLADYSFQNDIEFADIPPFFYSNSIAILFPYVRAFISTLSLQANYPPMILPTLNLSALGEELKAHTQAR